jgi:malate synthase
MESLEVREMMADPARRASLEEAGKQYVAMLEQWFAAVREAAGRALTERRQELEEAERARTALAETAAHYWQTRENWVQAPTGSPSASTS